MTWQEFVLAHGWRARGYYLAHILNRSEEDIEQVRRAGACQRGARLSFADLFTRWHGRAPTDSDWPAPRKIGGGYEWLGNELALLASLVGRLGTREIQHILTERLQRITGDRSATRNGHALARGRLLTGLQTSDVVGGITVQQAARSIGISSILYTSIAKGQLRAHRVGRHLVIPHDAFEAWKASRVFPPSGFVPLAPLKQRLGIRSDKLSEFARMGYIPTAVRCNPYGTRAHRTQFGTWWIAAKIANRLLADRRAGRRMPWQGRPQPDNLKATWTLWRARRHPAGCSSCQSIWGAAGAPTTFEEYANRYPPLAHGAKRHLTRRWSPGLAPSEVARHAGVSVATVHLAIRNGVLAARRAGRRYFVTRTEATRWKYRHCATGEHAHSWLALPTAARSYAFTVSQLRQFIADGALRSKVGTNGPQRGLTFVLKTQVGMLREQLGFTEREAARRVGVSITRLRVLLRGLEWRPAPHIPLQVVQNAIKRRDSSAGVTIAAAARLLGKSRLWVEREIAHGTARVLRARWDRRRRYLSAPMMRRLLAATQRPSRLSIRWTKEWLLVSDAAVFAGVSAGTMQRWADVGDVRVRLRNGQRRYHKRSVKARARRYWTSEVRFKRAQPPEWWTRERLTQEAA